VARIEGGRKGRRLCWCLPRCGREGRYEDQGGRGAAEVFSREGGREGGRGWRLWEWKEEGVRVFFGTYTSYLWAVKAVGLTNQKS
jgi:hypothetical protein